MSKNTNCDAVEEALAYKQEELEAQRGMLSAAIDELRKQNTILQATVEEVKDKNQQLEELLYHSAHGMKSPITSIQGLINLLRIEYKEKIPEDYLSHIESKSNVMMNIVASLGMMSAIISKKVEKEKTDIVGIIKDIEIELKDQINANKVRFEYHIESVPKEFYSDPQILRFVIFNLVHNAVIFRNGNSNGGVVRISVSSSDKNLTIRVEDDGMGIDTEIRENIFQRFFRGAEKSGGPGLGLYIAKSGIELLNGSLELQPSDLETCFEINLPG